MDNDRHIATRTLELQSRARDYLMVDLPGYLDWSERKLSEGEMEPLIAHLDATSMWLLPEEAAKMTEEDYEDMLEDLRANLGEEEDDD